MKVKELIEELKKLDGDLLINTVEGSLGGFHSIEECSTENIDEFSLKHIKYINLRVDLDV